MRISDWSSDVCSSDLQKGDLWVRLQPRIDAMLAPFGEKAIATLAPAPGDGVLEIGCGTGSTTLTLAGRIGPTGRILAVAISRPMLRTAVARAAGTSAPEIASVEADATVPDFGPGGFAAASRTEPRRGGKRND